MSPLITVCVLGAAFFHAVWNALLRSTPDRKWGMLIINLTCPIISIPLLLLLPLPPHEAWPYILISSTFVAGYTVFLIKAYEHGELGQVYPVARGISPLLVTIGAAITAHEIPGARALIGICLISCGIIALAETKHHLDRKAFISAIITGCFIAAYTVTDGIGIRFGGDALAYSSWRSFFCTFIVTAIYWRDYRTTHIDVKDRETQKAAAAAVIAVVGYAIIIWAMRTNAMGTVSALRETSVVFAFLIGILFLKEKASWRRGLACLVIMMGAICLH